MGDVPDAPAATAAPGTPARGPTGRSNWGRWGEGDERGAVNLIGSAQVLEATSACRTGRVYQLGLRVQRRGVPLIDFRPAPERYSLFRDTDDATFRRLGFDDSVGVNEDVLVVPTHNGTHMDALAHLAVGGTIYNGFDAATAEAHRGAGRCGIEKLGPVVGRAVVLDVAGHLGVEWLEPGTPVGSDLLESCRAASGLEVLAGHVLLVRTGWLDLFAALERGVKPPFEQPGLSLDAVDFIADHDVAVVGADNAAVEVIPFDQGRHLGLHQALLHGLGVTMLEHLMLSEVAADRCGGGLFVAAPLPVTGGSGSPVNPVLIT